MSQDGLLKNKNKGFTLIELLVVISIISLLSSVVMASINDSRERARLVAGEKLAQSIRNQYGAGLVLKYDFENDNTSVVKDVSGNNLDGVITGSYSYIPSSKVSGRTINLSGGYITIPSSISLKKDVTISIRFKVNSDRNWQRLFDFGYGMGEYLFLTTKSNKSPNVNNPRFAITKSGESGERVVSSSKRLSINKWYHMLISIDSSAGSAILYLDGQEVGRISNLNIFPDQVNTSLNYVGKSNFSWDPNFLGEIDYVEIYNNPITDR
jgi:prepilin-type N-terminal cleavage/methylation domain-containing protein